MKWVHTCLKGTWISTGLTCRYASQITVKRYKSSSTDCLITSCCDSVHSFGIGRALYPYWALFSPLDHTASWLSHLALAIYMSVVVNFDSLTEANSFQIERRELVFLCWMQDLNPGSQTPNREQTECPLTNRLCYQGSSKSLNSTAHPYDQRPCSIRSTGTCKQY